MTLAEINTMKEELAQKQQEVAQLEKKIKQEELIMTIQEISSAVIGKTFSFYDSFNGSSEYVKNIKKVDHYIRVIDNKYYQSKTYGYYLTGVDSWGHDHKIFVDKDTLKTLIETGKIERHYEVDHCSCTSTYTLK